MSIEYDYYLQNHKENVRRGLMWLQNNLPDIFNNRDVDFGEISNGHDYSKYNDEEYQAYDAYFYGGNRSYHVVQDFNRAWLRHIHRNPHHWQHWVLINDNPDEGEIIIEMPYHYVIEMICDWWAFSWAQAKLDEIFSWYDKHKDYMKLHENTRKEVEHILSLIKAKLDEGGEA